jgi:hypothetical protein
MFSGLLLPISSFRIVLEVGNRTKTHASDLARQVDILPDDIRNFLQRWIIVQVRYMIGSNAHELNRQTLYCIRNVYVPEVPLVLQMCISSSSLLYFTSPTASLQKRRRNSWNLKLSMAIVMTGSRVAMRLSLRRPLYLGKVNAILKAKVGRNTR